MISKCPSVPLRAAAILGFAFLMAAGARCTLPIGPVPFTLQTLFVLLAGFFLGPRGGALAAILYLAAGACGLPVFAGGTGGLAKLVGPTGGFLIAFPLMAAIAGFATLPRENFAWPRALFFGTLASLLPFVLGLPWLMHQLGKNFNTVAATTFWPLLPGAALKLLVGLVLYRLLYREAVDI